MAWISFRAGHLRLDGVEEADELLVPVAHHIAADNSAVEDVEGREQCRCAMTLIVVGHRSGAALLHRQAGLSAVERLDLALLTDREDDGMEGRIDIEADDVAQLVDEARVGGGFCRSPVALSFRTPALGAILNAVVRDLLPRQASPSVSAARRALGDRGKGRPTAFSRHHHVVLAAEFPIAALISSECSPNVGGARISLSGRFPSTSTGE